MSARSRPLAIIAITILVALSGVVPAVGVLAGSSPIEGASASPPGFVGVPEDRVTKSSAIVDPANPPTGDLPAYAPEQAQDPTDELPAVVDRLPDEATAHVLSSEHADTLSGQFAATPEGELTLVLTDDVHHTPREVAVPAGALEEAIGHRPKLATGIHENGTAWTSAVAYEDGYAVFEVPGFSTNTVTWSGQYTIQGVTDNGAQFEYEQGDVPANNFTIDVTGVESTEQDLDSGTLTNGESLPVEIAGNQGPAGPDGTGDPELTIIGTETDPVDHTVDETVEMGDSQTLTADGNVITGPSVNDEPTLEVTGQDYTYAHDTDAKYLQEGMTKTYDVGNLSGSFDEVTVYNDPGTDSGSTWSNDGLFIDYDVYVIVGEGASATETKVASDSVTTTDDGWYTIPFDTTIDISGQEPVSVKFDTTSADSENIYMWNSEEVRLESASFDVEATVGGTTHTFGALSDGETDTVEVSIEDGDNTVSWSGGGVVNASIEWTEQWRTEDPSVTIDGQTVNHSGYLGEGETVSDTVTLSTGSYQADASLTDHEVTVEVDYTEVEHTEDPVVEVNGETSSHTGVISPGSTQSLTADSAWVNEGGTNRVNVSVGASPTADDPVPQIDLDYSHDGDDKTEVSYEGEKWSERYNVSKTFAQNQSNAELTIPFQGSVVAIRDVETRTNGGTWSAPEADSLDGTTLTVDLGSVTAGDTVDVRANGSKVTVKNGTISVLEPTSGGQSLDSEIELVDWADDSYIDVGGTDEGDQIHYVTDASWSGADAAMRVTAGGSGEVSLPNAPAGGTARVRNLPVSVAPETGDVKVSVDAADVDEDEPVFHVAPGEFQSDTVEYTFLDARDGKTYALYSPTDQVVRDHGTASSPLTLEDDDSEETLMFLLESGSLTGGSDGQSAAGAGPIRSASPFDAIPLVLIAGVLAVVGATIATRRYISEEREVVLAVTGVAVLVVVVIVGEAFRPGVVLEPIVASVSDVVPALALGAGGLVLYWGYRRFIQGRDGDDEQSATIVIEGGRQR